MNHLESYRIFLYTARMGNFTKAAQELHITQPSVSYAVKQLEEAFGVKLFDRLSKGVCLTSEGNALYEYVEQSFALLARGEKKLHDLVKLNAGELRIGASGPIIKHLLQAHLEPFHAANPQIRIRIQQSKTSEVSRQLKEEQIDLGFVHLPLEDPELTVVPLMNIQDCFFVGEAYRELTHSPISVSQLLTIPLVLPTSGSSTRIFVEKWFASQGLSKEADIELNSTEMIVEFAQHGYGAAFVARQFAQKELDNGSLLEVKLIEQIPTRTIGVVTRREAALPLASARFLDRLLTP
ncbi:MAG: LysR family transcriptional regulator [Candidatus Pristimantibacillus sp.]